MDGMGTTAILLTIARNKFTKQFCFTYLKWVHNNNLPPVDRPWSDNLGMGPQNGLMGL